MCCAHNTRSSPGNHLKLITLSSEIVATSYSEIKEKLCFYVENNLLKVFLNISKSEPFRIHQFSEEDVNTIGLLCFPINMIAKRTKFRTLESFSSDSLEIR